MSALLCINPECALSSPHDGFCVPANPCPCGAFSASSKYHAVAYHDPIPRGEPYSWAWLAAPVQGVADEEAQR